MIRFDEFENEQSISMVSVLVALGSFLLAPLFAGIITLLFVSVVAEPSKLSVFTVFGSAWASSVAFLIWYASKAVKRTNQPHLGTSAFLVFQLTAGFIFLLIQYLPVARNGSDVGLRYIFGAFLLVANLTFIILAKAIRSKISTSTYFGLLFDLVALVFPFGK